MTTKPTGYIIHEGTTGGRAFVAIATLNSRNAKTGDMVQIWFLLRDVNPIAAVQEGIDAETICKSCPFASGNGCYVNVSQAPLSVWKTYHAGKYPVAHPADYARIFGGRKIRFGAYGNPSLLPLSIVRAIAKVSAGWTGYFHDWRTNRHARQYAEFFMASTETADSYALARKLKLRTFHASPVQPAGTRECLSETHGISCSECKLCCGLTKAQQPSIWINPHGTRTGAAIAQAMA